jgi:hypothetical protein
MQITAAYSSEWWHGLVLLAGNLRLVSKEDTASLEQARFLGPSFHCPASSAVGVERSELTLVLARRL